MLQAKDRNRFWITARFPNQNLHWFYQQSKQAPTLQHFLKINVRMRREGNMKNDRAPNDCSCAEKSSKSNGARTKKTRHLLKVIRDGSHLTLSSPSSLQKKAAVWCTLRDFHNYFSTTPVSCARYIIWTLLSWILSYMVQWGSILRLHKMKYSQETIDSHISRCTN